MNKEGCTRNPNPNSWSNQSTGVDWEWFQPLEEGMGLRKRWMRSNWGARGLRTATGWVYHGRSSTHPTKIMTGVTVGTKGGPGW